MTTGTFLLSAWNWDPAVLLICVLAAALYFLRLRPKFFPRAVYFLLGLAVFFLSMASPLYTLANGYLFCAHMLQHLLMLLIIPPLVWMGFPASAGEGGKSRGFLYRAAKSPLGTAVAWGAGVGAMWLWHVPALCDAAASVPAVAWVRTITLLAMGALFWRPIVGPDQDLRLKPLAGILYLFTACLGCTLLGILITFSPVTICRIFMNPADPFGILPLIRNQWGLTMGLDQQIGGLLMWVPACLVYVAAILGLLSRWFREPTAAPEGGKNE
jgi:cytochrome c oxidase assembly factor CtaG